jgi:hypothetical protein
MKYAVEMDLSAIIYIRNFLNIYSGISKLVGRLKDRHHGDEINLL